MTAKNLELSTRSSRLRIKVFGIGGGGINVTNKMLERIEGVEFISVHSDAKALKRSEAHKTFLLGSTGIVIARAGRVREVTESTATDLRQVVFGADLVVIVACMSGANASGAASVIARLAKELGILTVAVVQMPALHEGCVRMAVADAGLALLEASADSVIAVSGESMFDILGDDCTQKRFFFELDDLIGLYVQGLVGVALAPGPFALQFEDLRKAVEGSGRAVLGTATACGLGRARNAVIQAIASPLLENIDLSLASRLMVHISAAPDSLTEHEYKAICEVVQTPASSDSLLTVGTTVAGIYGDQIRVTVVGSGMTSVRAIADATQKAISPLYLPYLKS